MQAAVLKRYGIDGLRVEARQTPSLQLNEVLIQNQVSSFNPVDLETIAGQNKMLLPMRPPFVPGVDVAGEVLEPGDSSLSKGARVVAFTGVPTAGAFAQEVCVPASAVAEIPKSVSTEQAAALCLSGLAGWRALQALRLSPESTVLVHGAAGAVGSAAAQLAIAKGHQVIANVRSKDRELVLSWGVHKALCYDEVRFEEGCGVVDGVIDTVGKDTFKRSLRITSGAVASLKAVPGPSALQAAGFAVPWLLRPILGLAAAPKQKAGVRIEPVITTPSAEGLKAVMALAASGKLQARVDRTVGLEERALCAALQDMGAGKLRGKCLIAMS